MRRLGVKAAGLCLAVGGAVALGVLEAQSGPRTIRDGVYTTVQAARGAALFESICMSCHDVGEFTGAGAYLDDVAGDPLWETFDYISAEMPEDDPASLELEDYAAVLAFIFERYGVPAGEAELPTDAASLREISIAAP